MSLKENPIYDRSSTFALQIVEILQTIPQDAITRSMISQLTRSVTSIAANISEASFAASRKDFINKITIALKEAHETHYWLKVLASSKYISQEQMLNLNDEIISITNILSAIRQNTAAKAV